MQVLRKAPTVQRKEGYSGAKAWVHKQWDRTYRLNDNNAMKYCMLIKSVQFCYSVVADSL